MPGSESTVSAGSDRFLAGPVASESTRDDKHGLSALVSHRHEIDSRVERASGSETMVPVVSHLCLLAFPRLAAELMIIKAWCGNFLQ